MRASPGRVMAVLTVSAVIAVLASPACSSTGSGGDAGDESGDTGQGGDSSTATGTGGAGATSSGVGGAGAGTSKGGSTSAGKGGSGTGGGILGAGGGPVDAGPDPDAFFANDPPPMSCDGGGVTPPTPGGTPDCPDDKNRQGCACPQIGATAACWPGFRKDRHHGSCKDGMTTCVAPPGELQVGAWGPCEGYVLPDPTAKSGPATCKCFSGGQWKLDNLSPCFVGNAGMEGSQGALSTIDLGGGNAMCPDGISVPLTAPTQPWAKNTLKSDCAGHFKLCYTLKAGSATAPVPSDCTVSEVCTEADYVMENVVQPFPDLPGWATTDSASIACAAKFAQMGGYGEMSVKGISIECDTVDDHVFNRVQYCPLSCNTNPSGPGCANCMNGGGGSF